MIVKKMFGFLIDDKFVSHEELALEFEKLQAENKKLREALELIEKMRGGANQCNIVAKEALRE